MKSQKMLSSLRDSEVQLRALVTKLELSTGTHKAAHDVRNGLSVVLTYQQLLEDSEVDDLELLYDACRALSYAGQIMTRVIHETALVLDGIGRSPLPA